mgnify:CR=1 FL=1
MTDFNETIDTLNDMGTTGYQNLRKLGEMQMNNWNKIFEKQMETFSLLMGNAVSQAELLNDSKDYPEILTSQMTLTQKLAEELVEKSRESAEVMQQAGDEYRGWAEDVARQAADKVSAVAQKAA